MASVSFISTSKLVQLLTSADQQKVLRVRVLNSTHLSLETEHFQQVSLIDLAEEKIVLRTEKIEMAEPAPRMSRKSGKYNFVAFGYEKDTYSLKELLAEGLKLLEKKRPGTLEKLAKIKNNTKRIVSKNPADLFDTEGLSERYAEKLTNEWWYGTNNSRQETSAWLQRACKCAGVKWGADFSTSL